MKKIIYMLLLIVTLTTVAISCKKIVKPGHVENLFFDEECYTIQEGSNVNLNRKLTILPEAVADTVSLSWSVDKPEIADISNTGNVIGILEGTTTAKVVAQGKEASCIIKVTAIPITDFTLDASASCYVNISKEINLTCEPKEANPAHLSISFAEGEDSNISYKLSGRKLFVTASATGKYTLTVTNGDVTKKCAINASVNKITSVDIAQTEVDLVCSEGDTKQVSLKISPTDASYAKEVFWESSNTKVFTVDTNGVITAIKEGSATLTAKVGKNINGETIHTASRTVKVISTPLISSFTLSPTQADLYVNKTLQLEVSDILPEGAVASSLTWSSSDNDLATVDNKGLVTAVGKDGRVGVVSITASQGSVKRRTEITIKKKDISKIKWSMDTLRTFYGYSYELNEPVIEPSDASYQDITYTVDDPTHVSVRKTYDKHVIITVSQTSSLITYNTYKVYAEAGGKKSTLKVLTLDKKGVKSAFTEEIDKYGGFGLYETLRPASFTGNSKIFDKAEEFGINFYMVNSPETTTIAEENYVKNTHYPEYKMYYKNNQTSHEIVDRITFSAEIKDYNGTPCQINLFCNMHNSKKTPTDFMYEAFYMFLIQKKCTGGSGTVKTGDVTSSTLNLKYGPYVEYGRSGYFYDVDIRKYYYNQSGQLRDRSVTTFSPVAFWDNQCSWSGTTDITIGCPRDPNKQTIHLKVSGKP